MQAIPRATFLLLFLAGVLAASPLNAAAGAAYYGILVRSQAPPDYLVLERVEINGEDELAQLTRNGPLTEGEYRRLSRLSFAQVRSFRVSDGVLMVQRRDGRGELALPRGFNDWARTYVAPSTITAASILQGRLVNRDQRYSSALNEGWVLYLFSAYPDTDAVAFVLAEAENTEKGWSTFLQDYPKSTFAPQVRRILSESLLARVQAALDRYDVALRQRTPGYAALQEAREWFDKIREMGVTTPEIAAVGETLASREADITQRLRQAHLLAQEAHFDEAERVLEPILHFRPEMPELQAELKTIQTLRLQRLLDRSRQLLADGRLGEASKALDEAAAYGDLPEIARLRSQIEERRTTRERQGEIQQGLSAARAAAGRKDYARAFEILAPLIQRYPREVGLRSEFSSLQQIYTRSLLQEAAHVEELHTPIRGPADERAVIEIQRQLAAVAQFDSTPAASVWRDRLGMTLADYYHTRSQEIADRSGSGPSPLAFAYLQQARHFLLDKTEIGEFDSWREQVEKKLRIGLQLTFRDLTPEANGAYLAAELSTQVGAAIQQAGFPHVQILDPIRPEGPRPVLELVVEILSAGVEDSSQTETVSSEYAAGTRQAPNPKWREAKTKYDEAVDRYERVRARVEENRRKTRYSDMERRQDDEALRRAEVALDKARKEMDIVPAFIEEQESRPYEFTRRTVTRTGTIRLAYRWVNTATGVREEQQLFEEKDSAEGVETTGVQPGDKNGYRNQPADLPDSAAMRTRVMRKLQSRLAERAVAYLNSHIERDFERGQQEASRGNQETAADYYLRFLFNSTPDDAHRQQALDYLEREFRFVALGDWLTAANRTY
jgi:hypothetical protein